MSQRTRKDDTARSPHPPSMDFLLGMPQSAEAITLYGRAAVKEELYRAIAAGEVRADLLVASARGSLDQRFAPSLERAINGTGVLLHTNLGRSPLSREARAALARVSQGYATLEYNPATGERGRRQDHIHAGARDLFGCEDALAVNNNAAGVFLALSALARGRRVLVSRGELVAIGGTFKIPEILESSGATLLEVGTTNRTSIEDYRRALDPSVSLLLTVHPSNYEVRGYVSRPDPRSIGGLVAEAGIPWLHDQGTGCVVPLDEYGVADEPTVAGCLADGASLVTFSADKLFGGPQAGFVLGRGDLVSQLAGHPVARVVRPDKLTLAALAATLIAWKTEKWRELPIYRAAGESLQRLEERAEAIRGQVRQARAEESPQAGDGRLPGASEALSIDIVASFALFGGGTSPEKRFPSRALSVESESASADELAARLRGGTPPIVCRIEEGGLLLDLRSIDPEEDGEVAAALSGLL